MHERIGAYRLLRELGTGGMGTVYLAEVEQPACGLEPGAQVAIKVVHEHLQDRPDFFKRFLREAELGARVRHENVVRCLDCDFQTVGERGRHVLVMEYVEGQTLRELLAEIGRAPEELARHLGREIAEGLVAIHAAGAIHRDLKPENVLITPAHAVKIMDLGVARLQDEAIRLSRTGHFAGSLQYAAPECFRERGRGIDVRADLYSLGVLLYEAVTGVHPFGPADVQTLLYRILDEEPRRVGDLNPQVSPFFEEVVHRLIAKDPEERFAIAEAVREVLAEGEDAAWWEDRSSAMRRQTERPLRRVHIPRETTLFGRGPDVETLTRCYRKAVEGEGQVVLVEGEAGIGKTRLVDEFVAGLRRDGEDLDFLFGSYPPGGAATGAGAFSTAWREHLGSVELVSTLRRLLPETSLLAPAFAALLRGEPAPVGSEPLTKESLHTVFVHAARALAAKRPTVILIDDLHFAPEEGRALFTSLALAVSGHRILLIGTLRPGPSESWLVELDRQARATRLPLTRLGPKDLEGLLLEALGSTQLAAELGWKIATKSDGNPYFVFEILRGLREDRLLRQRADGTWVSTSTIRDVQVPSSILDLVNARVAELSREERDLLELAACCGFSFDPDVVAEASEQERLPTLKLLARVERRHRLVRSAGRRFVFDHHQVQEALYAGMSEPLREEYHGLLARGLERLVGAAEKGPEALGGAVCAELCEHHLAARRGAAALPYLDGALEHLESGHLHDAAADLAGRALDVGGLLTGTRRVELLLRRARALDVLGRIDEVRAALDEALTLTAGDSGLEARVRTELGWQLERTSRIAEAEAELERARALAVEAGDAKTASLAEGYLGIALLEDSRFEASRPHLEARLAWLEAHGPPAEVPPAAANVALLLWKQGQGQAALERLEEVLRLAREVGNRRAETAALGNLSILYRTFGRIEEARQAARDCLASARRIGERRGEANATMSLGGIVHGRGSDLEARTHYEHAHAIYREVGDRRGEAYALGNLGILTSRMGRIAESLDWYRLCIEASDAIEDRWGRMNATGDQAYCLLRLGLPDDARDAAAQALEIACDIEYEEGQAEWHLALAEIEEGAGRLDEARRQAERTLALCGDDRYPESHADALLVLGRLDEAEGRIDAATRHYAEAVERGRAADSPQVFLRAAVRRRLLVGGDAADEVQAAVARVSALNWNARLELAWWLWGATGERAHLDEARRLLEHLREHAPLEHREAMVDRVPLYGEILAACAGSAES